MESRLPLVKGSLLYAPLKMLEKELGIEIGLIPVDRFLEETPPLLIVNGGEVVAIVPDRFMCSAAVLRGAPVDGGGVDGYVWRRVEFKKFEYCYLPPRIITLLSKYFGKRVG